MTMDGKKEEKHTMTYDEVEAAFLDEAGTLIPEEKIEAALAEEKKRFAWADALDITPVKFAGTGISRYAKGMLRKNQPFPWLYAFLGFMMEFSMILLLTLFLYGVFQFLSSGAPLLEKREYFYGCAVCAWYLAFRRFLSWRYRNFFFMPETGLSPEGLSEGDKQRIQKKAALLPVVSAVLFLCLGLVFCYVIKRLGAIGKVSLDLASVFLLYVLSAVLSGIHNVIFSSHFISYFSLGRGVLLRKSKEEHEKFITHYKMLCYQRIVRRQGKTMEDFSSEEKFAAETMQKLRADLVTYRVYAVLGFFLFFVLDVLCIIQLTRLLISVPMVLFTVCSVFITFLFLVAFLSANEVIKTLPGRKRKLK